MSIQFKGSQAAADADSNFPVAPAGTYYLTVVEAKEGMTKGNNGNPKRPMLELELVVSNGEYEDKVRIWHYLTFIEAGAKGHGMTLHALHAFGFETEGENDYSAQQFVGRTVKAELDIDTYQGKRKNIIKKFVVDEDAGNTASQAKSTSDDEEKVPGWVEEGTLAGAQKTAAARVSAPVAAAAAPRSRVPWRK